MKKPFTQRETAVTLLAAVSLVLFVGTGICAANLHAKTQDDNTITQANAALLRQKDVESNKSANYTETICAEYRKLYQAYKELSVQHPPASGIGYALPGSAKGEVDECYRPE